jgi:hypothetical protein
LASTRHDGHAGFGLIGDVVEVRLGASEIIRQRDRVGIEIDEPEAAVLLEARHGNETTLAVVLVAVRIGALLWDEAERAVAAKHPAMIETLEDARLAGFLPAHAATAMGAEVVENVHLAGGIAAEDEIASCDGAGQERAALRQLGVVAKVEPALLKNLLVLELEEFRIGEDLA